MPRATGDVRRAQILAASGRLVRQRGFTATRMVDVAAELGLSAPLIVYHFGTKDELMAATLAAEARRGAAAARRGRRQPGRTPLAKLHRILHLSLGSASVGDWALWIDAWGEGLRSTVMARHLADLDRRWRRVFERVITEGVRAGEFAVVDARTAADRVMALLDGYGVQLVRARSRAGTAAGAGRRPAERSAPSWGQVPLRPRPGGSRGGARKAHSVGSPSGGPSASASGGSSGRPAVEADEPRHDGDQEELPQQGLEGHQRLAGVGGRSEVAEAEGGQHDEAEVHEVGQRSGPSSARRTGRR